MRYKILKGILIAGVVLGFGSGFAHLGARWAMHCKDGRAHCERSCPDGSRWGRKPGPDEGRRRDGQNDSHNDRSAPATATAPASRTDAVTATPPPAPPAL